MSEAMETLRKVLKKEFNWKLENGNILDTKKKKNWKGSKTNTKWKIFISLFYFANGN